jgi:hypothetical protein
MMVEHDLALMNKNQSIGIGGQINEFICADTCGRQRNKIMAALQRRNA